MKIDILLLALFLAHINVFSQNIPKCKVLLEDASQIDSIEMFEQITLNIILKNDDNSPVTLGTNLQSDEKYFGATLEYRFEGDTIWHSYGTIYGQKKNAPAIRTQSGYVNISAGEVVGPISVELSAFMFYSLQPGDKKQYIKPISIYIRILANSPAKKDVYYSNSLKINLNNYSSSPADYPAFRYLMTTNNPGILTGCLMENNFSPCAFPNTYEISVLDTLIRLYPSSKFSAWAHAILAIDDTKNLSAATNESRNKIGRIDRVFDINRINSDLVILRRIKSHVLLALSANNPEVKKALIFSGVGPDAFFEWALYLIYYTKEFEEVDVPRELIEEFK